jgi:thioredoxin 1
MNLDCVDEKSTMELIMSSEPVNVTDDNFEKVILQSEIPVIVDFWAPWCGPCKMVAPILEKIAKEYEGKLLVTKVNTDENPKWAMDYGVQGIPTMLFIADGKVVHNQVGAVPEPYMRDMIDTFMSTVNEAVES